MFLLDTDHLVILQTRPQGNFMNAWSTVKAGCDVRPNVLVGRCDIYGLSPRFQQPPAI